MRLIPLSLAALGAATVLLVTSCAPTGSNALQSSPSFGSPFYGIPSGST